MFFVDPATLPNASDFPTSNLATVSDLGIFYMLKNTSAVSNVGVVGTFAFITAAVNFTPSVGPVTIPASMGTNFSTSASADVRVYVGLDTTLLGCQIVLDSIWVKRTATLDVNFDGSGTTMLPTDTFTNSLRAYSEQRSTGFYLYLCTKPCSLCFPTG